MTTIVQFLGGPHVGKTTLCAKTFSTLNTLNKRRTEMSLEYAKEEVYNGNVGSLDNQIHVFGEQLRRIWRLNNKVDLIITDASLLNSIIYFKGGYEQFVPLVLEVYSSMNNINFLIKRDGTKDDYDMVGRYHTYEEAIELDAKILKLLEENNIPYIVIDKNDVDQIIREIEKTK